VVLVSGQGHFWIWDEGVVMRDRPGKFTVIYNKRRFFILIFTCQGFECAFMRDLRAYLAAEM
jgi:hypothetical protein